MAQLATASAKSSAEAKVKDAIDNLRSAAQDLHKQITDAAARKSGATKADRRVRPPEGGRYNGLDWRSIPSASLRTGLRHCKEGRPRQAKVQVAFQTKRRRLEQRESCPHPSEW